MRFSPSPVDAALLTTLVFPFLTAAISFDCGQARAGGVTWDLSALGGPKSVMHSEDEGASFQNTTYTIDLCKPLKRDDKVPEAEKCPGNTRLCAIERTVSHDGQIEMLRRAWPIAGELKERGGGHWDPVLTRLKTAESAHDSKQEGVRLSMNGGFWKEPGAKKTRYQKAIIEFICDKDLVGDENLWNPEDKYQKREEKENGEKDGDNKDGEVDEPVPKNASSLIFESYDLGEEIDTLRLTWRTKYACEDAKDEKDEKEKEQAKGWGFFTWFVLIAFLSTATYLIFGSWLNYNRYGARGWDLLPHGDTIRDVPYLLKDWIRRVLNTLQGGGTRGGYAAV